MQSGVCPTFRSGSKSWSDVPIGDGATNSRGGHCHPSDRQPQPGPTPPELPPPVPPPVSGAASSTPPPAPPVSGATSSGATSSGTTSSSISSGATSTPPSSASGASSAPPPRRDRGAGSFAALFEAVFAGGGLEFFERRGGAGGSFFAAFCRELEFALAAGELVGRGDHVVVAGFVVGRTEALDPFDHPDVEIGRLGRLLRRFRFGAAERADGGVDLAADRIAAGDQIGLAQRRRRHCRSGGRGRVVAAPAAAGDGQCGQR